ncbi:MAG: hypothetical protein WCJ29_02020 [bacterium]
MQKAVKELDDPRTIKLLEASFLAWGYDERLVKRIIRDGFRRHIQAFASDPDLTSAAVIIQLAIQCGVDEHFMMKSFEAAVARAV